MTPEASQREVAREELHWTLNRFDSFLHRIHTGELRDAVGHHSMATLVPSWLASYYDSDLYPNEELLEECERSLEAATAAGR